jgi:hypothetical protein
VRLKIAPASCGCFGFGYPPLFLTIKHVVVGFMDNFEDSAATSV